MSALAWQQIVDAAISSFRATLAAVEVYDFVPITEQPLERAVVVGANIDDDTGAAGQFTQTQRDLGPYPGERRSETGTVRCSIIAQNGDSDVRSCRLRAFDVLEQISECVRVTPSLGLDCVLWVELRSADVSQGVTSHGAFCAITFSLSYEALV